MNILIIRLSCHHFEQPSDIVNAWNWREGKAADGLCWFHVGLDARHSSYSWHWRAVQSMRVAVLSRICPSRWTPHSMRNWGRRIWRPRNWWAWMPDHFDEGTSDKFWEIINHVTSIAQRMWGPSRWTNSRKHCDSHALHSPSVSQIWRVSCVESYVKPAQTVSCFPFSSVLCVHDVRRLFKVVARQSNYEYVQ